MAGEWAFLVDECVDPDVAVELESDSVRAEAVKDALWMGADDVDDVLPYVRQEDLILITSDVTDFRGLDRDEHAGIIVIFDNELRVDQIVAGVRSIMERYPSRHALRAYEKLDPWIPARYR